MSGMKGIAVKLFGVAAVGAGLLGIHEMRLADMDNTHQDAHLKTRVHANTTPTASLPERITLVYDQVKPM